MTKIPGNRRQPLLRRRDLFGRSLACLGVAVARSLAGILFIAAGSAFAVNLESGQYFLADMSTNDLRDVYEFQAYSNDTVLIRVANEDPYMLHVPDVLIYYQNRATDPYSNQFTASLTQQFSISKFSLAITNNGWFNLYCDLPLSLYQYSNPVSYSVSMLRMPEVPLSYADLDVGFVQNGQSKYGIINVGADLDAATFPVSNRCTVQFRMGQDNVALVADIQLYDTYGRIVTNDYPPEYRSEVTATLTNTGIYTVSLNDFFNGAGQYAVSMIKIGDSSLSTNDTDLGMIVSGETKGGTIHAPGDLDAAFFSASSGDVVQLTMTEVESDVNPVIELYNPAGARLKKTSDVYQISAVLTNTLVTNGLFTVICKDAEDRKNNVHYTLTMEFLAGSPSLYSIPAVPSGLSATDGTYSNRIDVTWNTVSGANGYDIWRSYGTNDPIQLVTNETSTIYQDYDVTVNVVYYYKAKARNAYGVSTNYSNTDSGYAGTAVAAAPTRRALVVGIDNYSPSYGATPLTTTTNDALGIRGTMLLGDPSNRWSSTNITLLLDSQATKVMIQNQLHTLANDSSSGDLVLYFHSSHGGVSNVISQPGSLERFPASRRGQSASKGATDTFISTYDADYTDAELATDLALFGVDTSVIVIIDACNSGGAYQLDGGAPFEWLFAERVMAHYHNIQRERFRRLGLAVPKQLGQNIAFMVSSDYDELSWTSSYYSLYTEFLIGGCSLTAVDTSGDDEYSFLELHTYAAAQAAAVVPSQNAQTYNSTLLQSTIARAAGIVALVQTNVFYNDFDADGASDLATFNPTTGRWRIASLKRWLALAWDNFVWGGPGFRPIDGDYDGDGASDGAIYNEQTGEWRIGSLKRARVLVSSVVFGGPGKTPVSGDYDNDRISDGALYEQPDGFWHILTATGTQLVDGVSYFGAGFTPVSGDFDGDRRSDLAVYQEGSGNWYIGSLTNGVIAWGKMWGGTNLVAVSGDYDADGTSDLAVYHRYTGAWYIYSLKNSATLVSGALLGGAGYTAVPGDYNGDSYDDLAVYQESTGYWFFLTVNGQSYSLLYPVGGPGYIPVLPMW
ncbi:MAG: VCBS repeat-containing protein [Lentisphaerae bacterium]|nr:VCBS repeat-containing protein [Lentisphaerota bacterium]